MNNKKISIIIPTIDRPKQLSNLLTDLSKCNLTSVKDIIVVDESRNNNLTKKTVFNFVARTKNFVKMDYFKVNLNSLSRARNFGVKKSSGDLVLIFDDDIRVYDKKFFNKVLNIYNKESQIILLGILPKREKSATRFFYELVRCFFMFNHPSKPFHVFFIGRNGGYINLPNVKICEAEWVATCSMVARKEIFDKVKFENRFIKYSFGEDFLFSHQVFKKFGKKAVKYLLGTNIVHLEEPTSRIHSKERICMEHSYRIYISNELGFIPNFSINKFLWKILILWGAIGDTLFTILVHLTNNRQVTREYFKMALSHLRYCCLSLKYEREIKADPNFILTNIYQQE